MGKKIVAQKETDENKVVNDALKVVFEYFAFSFTLNFKEVVGQLNVHLGVFTQLLKFVPELVSEYTDVDHAPGEADDGLAVFVQKGHEFTECIVTDFLILVDDVGLLLVVVRTLRHEVILSAYFAQHVFGGGQGFPDDEELLDVERQTQHNQVSVSPMDAVR